MDRAGSQSPVSEQHRYMWKTPLLPGRDRPPGSRDCPECKGTGYEIKVLGEDPMTGATFRQVGGKCPHCEGRGYVKGKP